MLTINKENLTNNLIKLNPVSFEVLLGFCNITFGVIPDRTSTRAERVKALVHYYDDTFSSLDKLYELTYKIIPLNVIENIEEDEELLGI